MASLSRLLLHSTMGRRMILSIRRLENLNFTLRSGIIQALTDTLTTLFRSCRLIGANLESLRKTRWWKVNKGSISPPYPLKVTLKATVQRCFASQTRTSCDYGATMTPLKLAILWSYSKSATAPNILHCRARASRILTSGWSQNTSLLTWTSASLWRISLMMNIFSRVLKLAGRR